MSHSKRSQHNSDNESGVYIAAGKLDDEGFSSSEAGYYTVERQSDYTVGLCASALGHMVLAYALLFMVGSKPREFDQVVYSVTIEGGKTLGGISQVARDDKKSQPAVPRNVSEPERAAAELKEPDKSVPEQPEKGAEVSLATPKPTVAPTAKAAATAKPTAAPKKMTPKATSAPKAPSKADLNREYQATMQKYLGESTNAGGKGFGAGKLGGSGMGGGALRPPEFFRYRDLLEAAVKGGWRWIDPQAKLSTTVAFDISADGDVSNVRIERSSGNREFDESVLRAVYKANPVPKPPPSVYEQYFRSVRMFFEPQ